MLRTAFVIVPLLALMLAPACRSAGLNNEDALSARKLEIQVDAQGKTVEIEYHIRPQEVPDSVRKAMDELHPGGPFTGAERETHGGIVYYELTRVVNGMEVEAMFLPDGTLHQEELQVPSGRVPQLVRATVKQRFPEARVDKWEEIRGPDRSLVEYHVKASWGGDHFKLVVSTDGRLGAVYREIPAEIEVETNR